MWKDSCQECKYGQDNELQNKKCKDCEFPDDGFYGEGSNFEPMTKEQEKLYKDDNCCPWCDRKVFSDITTEGNKTNE